MSRFTNCRRQFNEILLLATGWQLQRQLEQRQLKTETLLDVLRQTADRLGYMTSMAAAQHSAAVVTASWIHKAAVTDRCIDRQARQTERQTDKDRQTEQQSELAARQ